MKLSSLFRNNKIRENEEDTKDQIQNECGYVQRTNKKNV